MWESEDEPYVRENLDDPTHRSRPSTADLERLRDPITHRSSKPSKMDVQQLIDTVAEPWYNQT